LTELRLRFDRSALGALWGVLNPLAQVAIFALILSNVLQAKIVNVDSQYSFALYLCAGLACWNLFNDIVSRSLNLFIANGNLIKKAAFPKIVLLANLVGTCVLDNLLLLAAVLALFLITGFSLTASLFFLPLLLLLTIALATGIGLILGVLNTFIRDIGQVTPILLQMLFWFTPIVYPASIVPEQLQNLMVFNPVYSLVTGYQQILIFQTWPDTTSLLVGLVISTGLLLLGGFIYSRAAEDMADVL
jgi:lipopolysaccharide transport system permease protein